MQMGLRAAGGNLTSYIPHIIQSVVLIFSALFPIVNPLGSSPIFLSLTREYSSGTRTALSRKIAVNGFLIIIGSMITGTHILAFFGISLPVVQVGGGLLVIAAAWAMLNQKDSHGPVAKTTPRNLSPGDISSQAFYPLTLPLTVGPGSISVAITLGANERHSFDVAIASFIAALIASGMISVTIYYSYRFAERLENWLGETAMNVVLRLSSFILLCIGVQIVWNGVRSLLVEMAGTVHV